MQPVLWGIRYALQPRQVAAPCMHFASPAASPNEQALQLVPPGGRAKTHNIWASYLQFSHVLLCFSTYYACAAKNYQKHTTCCRPVSACNALCPLHRSLPLAPPRNLPCPLQYPLQPAPALPPAPPFATWRPGAHARAQRVTCLAASHHPCNMLLHRNMSKKHNKTCENCK